MRDWHIYAELAHTLIATARSLYSTEPFIEELDETVYALDSTTIDLCLSLFPWATFRKRKGAVKLHTLLDLRGNIPTFIYISDGKLHDVNVLNILPLEPGAFYVMDRGDVDFERLFWFSVNWRISSYELVYNDGGIHHAQTTKKLHRSGKGRHSQTAPC